MTCDLCIPRHRPQDPLPHWDAKEKHPGWYSRRHRTRDAQDETKARYIATHATYRARLARKGQVQ